MAGVSAIAVSFGPKRVLFRAFSDTAQPKSVLTLTAATPLLSRLRPTPLEFEIYYDC